MTDDRRHATVKGARVYLRVSTDEQDLARQEGIVDATRGAEYYVAAVYREKASGARADRPELLRMVGDLQPGEVVVAEKIDRISRLLLAEAERLLAAIRAKGARLAVPGIVDLFELVAGGAGVARIVLETVEMLLRVALQGARDDYEYRRERQRQSIEIGRGDTPGASRLCPASAHRRVARGEHALRRRPICHHAVRRRSSGSWRSIARGLSLRPPSKLKQEADDKKEAQQGARLLRWKLRLNTAPKPC